MNLDRLKQGIVRGVTGAILGTVNQQRKASNTNKELQSQKQFYRKGVEDVFPRKDSRSTSIIPYRLLQELSLKDCSPTFRADFTRDILDATPRHSDPQEVRVHKEQALAVYSTLITKMPQRKQQKQNIKRQVLTGRGKYTLRNFAGDVLTGAGTAAGGALGAYGGPYGVGIGGAVGGSLGREIGHVMGFGKYTVRRNSILKTGDVVPEGYEVPSFGNGKGTRVQHREYIRDVVVPANPALFSNTVQPINPGNSALFPFLSQVASQYQQYEFMGAVFQFKTLASDITAGGALGSVIMATDYDALATPFPNKVVMENSQYAVSSKPSCSQVHVLECDPSMQTTRLKYVRNLTSSGTVSQDNRFYDMGLFEIATQGLPGSAGTVIGELWVTYDIMLYKPEITPPLGGLVQHIVGTGNVSKTNFFGDTPALTGAAYAAVVGNTLTFNTTGTYIVTHVMNGTTWDIPTVTGSAAWSLVSFAGPRPGSITNITLNTLVTVTNPSQTVVFNWGTTGAISTSITNITQGTSLFT